MNDSLEERVGRRKRKLVLDATPPVSKMNFHVPGGPRVTSPPAGLADPAVAQGD
jgi:hypothetical protein